MNTIMNKLSFAKLTEIDKNVMLTILNKASTRKHLIHHEQFTLDYVEQWILGKLEVDAAAGCKVRAVELDGVLAGWCGIQQEKGEYEVAIVIDDSHWGLGKRIFDEMMLWAIEMGHNTLVIHLLKTRPKYKFLEKIACKVSDSIVMGESFTSYQLDVSKWQ